MTPYERLQQSLEDLLFGSVTQESEEAAYYSCYTHQMERQGPTKQHLFTGKALLVFADFSVLIEKEFRGDDETANALELRQDVERWTDAFVRLMQDVTLKVARHGDLDEQAYEDVC